MLVVGFGNSAMDIACETSRVSTMTYLSTRRGGWVIPKYLGDKPVDEIGSPRLSRHAALARPRALRASDEEGHGPDGGVGPAEARPQAARGAPDDLLATCCRGSATGA